LVASILLAIVFLNHIAQLDYMSNISCFFVEFLGTALLVLMVLAATDKKNNSPPKGLLPLTLFLTLLGLGLGFGMQTCKISLYCHCYSVSELISHIQRMLSTPRVTSVRVFSSLLLDMESSCIPTAGMCSFLCSSLFHFFMILLSQYWLWCPIIGPIVGAQIAAIFYDLFLNENGRFGEDEEL
jgi:aquaglyceroporin related protein